MGISASSAVLAVRCHVAPRQCHTLHPRGDTLRRRRRSRLRHCRRWQLLLRAAQRTVPSAAMAGAADAVQAVCINFVLSCINFVLSVY